MTPAYTAALAHYKTSSGWHGMPWEADEVVIDEAFRAGYEAATQFAPVAQPVEQQFCKLPVLSSNLGGGSTITVIAQADRNALAAKLNEPSLPLAAMDDLLGPTTITAAHIYAAYPRKVGKTAALKAIQRAIRHIGVTRGPDGLLERTKAYAAATAQWPAADKQFIPHPATWFNRGSYDDDPKEWLRGAAAAPSQFSRKAH